MANLSFNFKFKQVQPKKEIKHKTKEVLISNLIYCTCIKEDGVWKASVDLRQHEEYKEVLILPFTDKSFKLKGREKVFSIKPDETGRIVAYTRNKSYCSVYPGSPELLTPMAEHYCMSGYLMKVNGELQFDLNAPVAFASKCTNLLKNINDA